MPTESRVVEGKDVYDGKYNFLAYIEVQPKGTVCTGTIISHRHVLTAGHCIRPGERTTVSYGSSNRKTQSKVVAKNVIAYPDMPVPVDDDNELPYSAHDIGIVEMSEPVVFNDRVGRVCLAKLFDPQPATVATVAGWGFNREIGKELPSVAEENEVFFYPPKMCKSIAPKINDSYTLCAGGRHTGTEGGDSGGPLFVNAMGRYFQVGLTAFGQGRDDPRGNYDVGKQYNKVRPCTSTF